jgi:hypothetical protein
MCYRIRQQQTEAQPSGTTPPLNLERLRPRWIAAAGAAMIAGLAVAALVVPPSSPQLVDVKEAGAPAPVAMVTTAVPVAAGTPEGSLPADDGVPSASDVAKSDLGHCHHGL